MKIAILSHGFGGSTTSLIEAYLKDGYDVDFYNIVIGIKQNVLYETFELPIKKRLFSTTIIKSFNFLGLRRFEQYSREGRIKLYYVSSLNIHHHSIKMVMNIFSRYFIRHLACRYLVNKYCFINVIGQSLFTAELSNYLTTKGENVVHSIHEVCNNHLEGDTANEITQYLVNKKIKINVFSEKSSTDLFRLTNVDLNNVSVIPFSLFTGYQEYGQINMPELKGNTDFVLFMGYIVPYKGLNILFDAVKILKKSKFDKKIIIAGWGYDKALSLMKNDDSFIVINRWLNNIEVATLIRKCHVVVCPYLSSSQTGITKTVFNFDTPIIGSKVPAFVSTIQHNKTGLLFDINDSKELAASIKQLYVEKELYNSLCNNIRNIRNFSAIEWMDIVNQYKVNFIKDSE